MSETAQYKDLFISEAQDHLHLMNESFLELERATAEGAEVRGTGPALEQALRSAHTLKGMAGAMGYGDMARLAHAAEDVLDAVRHGTLALAAEHVALCFASVDVLEAALRAAVADGPTPPEVPELMRTLAALLPSSPAAPEAPAHPPDALPETGYTYAVRVTLSADCQLRSLRAQMVLQRLEKLGRIVATSPRREDLVAERFALDFAVALETGAPAQAVQAAAESVAEVAAASADPPGAEAPQLAPAAAAPPATAPAPRSAAEAPRSVRISVRQLDRLLNLIGELVITRGRLAKVSTKLGDAPLAEALEKQGLVVADLQAAVLAARLVPVQQVFDRFPRMVRDLLVAEGKEAEFAVSGRDVEADRMLLERLGDVIVHLLRNAIDHGLEPPDVRERQGKPRRGMLRLAAYREREMLVVETADDGRGISPDRVAETAVARGIISAEAAAALSQSERLMLICDPNFSTAEQVTDVSGRGVGLAAVRRQVEALRGELEISSEPGVGTRFRLRLPLTLTIIRALLVGAGGETYAVPFDYIDRIRDVGPGACVLTSTGDLLTPEGDRMPAYSLRGLLGVPAAAEAARNARGAYALIASRGMPVALLLDEVLGKEEIVVKPLPPMLQGIPGLAGATIVGAGDVVLILDVPQLAARLA